jgi:hypothetical protein
MRITVEIATPSRAKATGAREAQARIAELSAALRLVSDRIANTGAPEGRTEFEFGELKGSYKFTNGG